MCFALNGLFVVPSFTASETSATSSSVQLSIPAGSGNTTGTTDSAINSTGAAINSTGAAIDTSGAAIGTTGSAVDTSGAAIGTTGSAVGVTGAAVNVSGAAINTTNAAIGTAGGALTATPGAIASKADDESHWYLSRIPMKKEHQKLLWDYCKKRGLDYIDMLALISVESNFNEKCSSSRGRYKGYFQISSGHYKNLAATLKTPNKPLDGAVNINWGTAMYSWAMTDKRVKGLTGKKLRDAALSIYQRGTGGYDRYGLNKKYLAKYYKKWNIIVAYFKEKNERQEKTDRSE